MLKISTKSWWESDRYIFEGAMPEEMSKIAGPNDMALVRVFDDGSTQSGWGLQGKNGSAGFMERYADGEFLPKRALYRYEQKNEPFAFVMRSLKAVVVDIDGKNGGLDGIKTFGAMPATLSETSKSGNGYHLWYLLPDDWDDETGYNELPDAIGIAQGVDIRAVGCVYHYPQQRWNTKPMTELPIWLADRLREKKQKRASDRANLNKISTLDETEQLLMHAELIAELNKPIKAGARNNTLFAIGGKLKQAGVPDWEKEVLRRGDEIGLGTSEVEKIVDNIENYG